MAASSSLSSSTAGLEQARRTRSKHCRNPGPPSAAYFRAATMPRAWQKSSWVQGAGPRRPVPAGGRSGRSAGTADLHRRDKARPAPRRVPDRPARRIANASCSVVPSKRAMGGLRMCVVGWPGAGSAIRPSTRTTGNFDCAPARDRRSPRVPARKGRASSARHLAAQPLEQLELVGGRYAEGRRRRVAAARPRAAVPRRKGRHARGGNGSSCLGSETESGAADRFATQPPS